MSLILSRWNIIGQRAPLHDPFTGKKNDKLETYRKKDLIHSKIQPISKMQNVSKLQNSQKSNPNPQLLWLKIKVFLVSLVNPVLADSPTEFSPSQRRGVLIYL